MSSDVSTTYIPTISNNEIIPNNYNEYLQNFNEENEEEIDEIFSLNFDSSSTKIVSGYESGKICVKYLNIKKDNTRNIDNNISNNIEIKNIDNNDDIEKFYNISEYPITAIKWNPYNNNIILAVSANGYIFDIHAGSGKLIQSLKESNNSILSLDISKIFPLFSTAGSDKKIRIYDLNTYTESLNLTTNNIIIPPHSNHIFSVKFMKKYPNLLISGGWDNTILIYDIRTSEIVYRFYGPHICGEGIDDIDNKIYTASYSEKNQIQVFDIRNNNNDIKFPIDIGSYSLSKSLDSHLYSIKINPKKDYICSTGSKKNTFYIFKIKNDMELIYEKNDYEKAVYTCDYDINGNILAIPNKGKIEIFDV